MSDKRDAINDSILIDVGDLRTAKLRERGLKIPREIFMDEMHIMYRICLNPVPSHS
ncbi:hypothetical protein GHT06_016381 [Daphnia sinensis]|uniref:Uncharacterized protein n=1 Tax=Daphnia sinensis TaxID=1820382 RepID=A0AAD5PQZ5_9CRUS|nr:hypothetical protein GHT06_016381 [Daphnia sinensis]